MRAIMSFSSGQWDGCNLPNYHIFTLKNTPPIPSHLKNIPLSQALFQRQKKNLNEADGQVANFFFLPVLTQKKAMRESCFGSKYNVFGKNQDDVIATKIFCNLLSSPPKKMSIKNATNRKIVKNQPFMKVENETDIIAVIIFSSFRKLYAA